MKIRCNCQQKLGTKNYLFTKPQDTNFTYLENLKTQMSKNSLYNRVANTASNHERRCMMETMKEDA